MLSFFRRKPIPKGPPFDIHANPYRAKRKWPPDFNQLSLKEQFMFERRFRRRHKLKWTRPVWIRSVKLVQWSTILFIAVYGVFFYEDKEGKDMPFNGVRIWLWKTMGSLFPSLLPTQENPALPREAQRRREVRQES